MNGMSRREGNRVEFMFAMARSESAPRAEHDGGAQLVQAIHKTAVGHPPSYSYSVQITRYQGTISHAPNSAKVLGTNETNP